MIEQTLKTLVDRFDNLSMHSQAMGVSGHPYEFLTGSFPTYDDFYNYFIDLAPGNSSQEQFGDSLFEIYHDLRHLPVAVSGMTNGITPENMERIFASMRKFTELTRKKYTQANVMMAQVFTNKH